MPFRIIREDITRVHADAIVNTANPKPRFGRGTDRAIYRAAGEEELLKERMKIGELAVGEAAATKAFGLRAKYIIHTTGPRWQDGDHHEREDLASCYRKSLYLARQLECESIAFPLISSGSYRFPKDEALRIALQEIRSFLEDEEMEVTLVVFDQEAFGLSEALTGRVDSYIDEHYAEEKREEEYAPRRKEKPYAAPQSAKTGAAPFAPYHQEPGKEEVTNASVGSASLYDTANLPELFGYPQSAELDGAPQSAEEDGYPEEKEMAAPMASMPSAKPKRRLEDLQFHVQESFQERLLRLIDEKGLTDVEVYKKANLDRKLFSKIRSNPAYQPKKRTALALAMALNLNKDETVDLISRAGLAFSPASIADLIVQYCIENGIYDLYTVNILLFDHDQQLLGAETQ